MRWRSSFQVLCAVALGVYVVVIFVTGPARNREVLGIFRPESKVKISHELDSLCDELQRRDVGRCGAVSWQGKHRWFGKVDLAGRFGPPPQTRVEAVIAELGWAPAENGDANTFEHAGMRLSLYLHVGSVHAIHVTTRI